MGRIRGGRTRNDPDPNNNRTKSSLSSDSPGGGRVKKRARSMDDEVTPQALIRSLIWGPTVSQILLRGVPKTPRADLTGI